MLSREGVGEIMIAVDGVAVNVVVVGLGGTICVVGLFAALVQAARIKAAVR